MTKKFIVLFDAIKEKLPITIGISIFMFFITPIIQSISTSLAFEIWFRDLYQKPLSSGIYIALSILVGIYVSLYLYTRNKCINCDTGKKERVVTSRSGFIGSFIGFMLGVCPACFSFIGFLVPLSTSIFLSSYTPIFTSIAIAIILFSIYKLGGFKIINIGLINNSNKKNV